MRRRPWRPRHGVTDVVMVRSCTRGGHGGSPTAVVIEHGPLGDTTRAAMARDMPASHTAFLCPPVPGDAELIRVRFFTRQGELSGCGHGTIAVMAVLVHMGVVEPGRAQLAIAGRVVSAASTAVGDEVEVWINHGDVPIGPAPRDMLTGLLAPLGLNRQAQMAGATGGPDGHRSVTRVDAVVSRPGAARLLVRVADRATLSSIRPDHVAWPRLAADTACSAASSTPPTSTRPDATRARGACSLPLSASTRTSPTPTAPRASPLL